MSDYCRKHLVLIEPWLGLPSRLKLQWYCQDGGIEMLDLRCMDSCEPSVRRSSRLLKSITKLLFPRFSVMGKGDIPRGSTSEIACRTRLLV